MKKDDSQSGEAVWYFVGSVFLFIGPILLFPNIELWGRILFTALGIVVMGAGFLQLHRELKRQ